MSAQERIILTEPQLSALEGAKEHKKAMGEIETHYPCYLGITGYLLCRQYQRSWVYLPANFH